ncbi:MAG: hypothetical protein JW944_01360, partial [Deltaproteobacteria bacterium]|nr:hypothetical protein [Deltaproteobacteria bacterium]
MDGLKLKGFRSNRTVEEQVMRGKGERSPFDTDLFRKNNIISLDPSYIFNTNENNPISLKDLEVLAPRVLDADRMLKMEEGDILDNGVPMTGWQNLPEEITPAHLKEIRQATDELSRAIDAFVSIGIGGSYLGIEATFQALTHSWFNQLSRERRGGAPEIYFLGQNMDPDYFRDTL